jgi:hypothetical protein
MLLLDVATRPVRGERNGKERERIEREGVEKKGLETKIISQRSYFSLELKMDILICMVFFLAIL